MKHFILVSGGTLEDEFICQMLDNMEGDHLIAVDSGINFFYRNHRVPHTVLGDFDSANQEALTYFKQLPQVQWHTLNPVKDDTDTEAAIRLAIRQGATEITVFGGTGSRLDHVLGNVELLGIGVESQIPITLLDAHNRIRMISQSISISKKEQFGNYVSLIPYTDEVEHLSLKGFKYPLEDFCLKGFSSLGVSNEIVDEVGEILFSNGILLVIESRD